MDLRGPITAVGDGRSVDTRYGERDLVELAVRPGRGRDTPVTVTLWGKWARTADHAEPGMEVLVTAADEDEYRGETRYATTGDSFVVLEPSYLVDVTALRSWVQCPRLYYLNKLTGVPLNYPVVKGTIVHDVFGDLLRGRDLDAAVGDAVADAGLELGLLGRDAEEVAAEVRRHAGAIEGWLAQGVLAAGDEWRSECTLIGPTFGLKGRADALRRGVPVELKTGKNTNREPRFHDKIQAACYALVLGDPAVGGPTVAPDGDGESQAGSTPTTGTLLYTKNAAIDRSEAAGDLSPAKDFSIGRGLLEFVVRTRNELAAMEAGGGVPTGHEADAICDYCFEQDTCMAVSGRLDQESKAGTVGTPIPPDERDYFERMYRAVEEERVAAHREYAKLWEQTPGERADDDRALIGLEPAGRERLERGRWKLRARRADEAVSKIREGDLVLASDGDPIAGTAEIARVERLGPEIVVTADEPVEVRRLDVYPSGRSADRMLTALHDALLKRGPEWKGVLFGRRAPRFGDESGEYVPNNAAQDRAVRRALAARDCALVHGPPGTGKTYTIARVVRELAARGERVLLSAFTNRAVDNALEALRDRGFEDVVRMGTEGGVRDDMLDLRLSRRGNPETLAAAFRDASVVAATSAACGSRIMRQASFDVAVVDEASQLPEPATLAAIALADRFVLVGDHQQLPPVTRTDNDLRQSLFERLVDLHPGAAEMLDRQYRMAQRIQAFSSIEFYDGALRPASGAVATQRVDDLPGVSREALPAELREPVAFIDPGGARDGNANPSEAARVAEVIETFLAAGLDRKDLGVIAPFRAQVAEIAGRVPDDVTVDTVDRFQGSSREVIVVSFVATGSLEGPLFEDERRVNVALTRARKALVLVGDAGALESDPFYARMLEWAR